ncbi:MAG TPA: DNA polymerase IV [Acholeplasmataceae bacterium]|nr:DNA polymerase IV [Acholeplasmataceae bacterium]
MKKEVKVIFHIDLNAFYASVASIKEPYLKNKAFAVAGTTILNRGMILSASYEARKYGIKAAMPITEAIDRYPKLLIVPPEFKEYRKYSDIFINFLKRYSNIILKASIDEAYIDMTKMSKHINAIELAKEIQTKLLEEYDLPVSIGIAPTLFLAKMASDYKKPLGITVIRRRDITKIIFPISIKELHGIGVKTYPSLIELGIKTIGDFTKEKYKNEILKLMTEEHYQDVLNSILGYSSDTIDPKKYEIPRSISNETTLNYNVDNVNVLIDELKDVLLTVHNRLINQDLYAKTVFIKIRNNKFETITRSQTIDYTNDYDIIYSVAEELFYNNYQNDPLRLIGAGVSGIVTKDKYREDYNLFNYKEILKKEKNRRN